MASSHIHLDPLGGLAGDMFLGAVLDAWPALAEGAFAAMRAAGLPEAWLVRHLEHRDGILSGSRVAIDPPAAGERAPHGMYVEIRDRIGLAALGAGVRERALAILGLLAEAEARVHGRPVEQVHFHELADWDSVADVVGAAFVIDALGAGWSCGPLPVGRGRIASSHGALPVPAPAAALLLQGFTLVDDGIEGERVTPTGAAILRHLGAAPGLPPGPWRLAATGIGFGTRKLPGMSNALRVLAYEQAAASRTDGQVAVATFEVDDQNPEELALGLEALRAQDGVLDVIQLAAIGKKGRLTSQVQLLVRPERLDAAIEACFAETTTLGLRWRIEARAVLAREQVAVGDIGVKIATRPGGVRTAKAEVDQVAAAPGGQAGRARRRQEAEALALRGSGDGGMSHTAELHRVLDGIDEIAVAVSGGVDSMTLAVAAGRRLGPRARMLHAISPAVPPEATARVRAHAGREGWHLEILDAGEFADPDYLRNPANRCYFCKTHLYGAMAARTPATLASGTNLDDLGDYRPGLQAASEHGVRHPYVEAGMDKAAVRALARAMDLDDLAALPAAPCLSSRLETGIDVTPARLRLVHAVERLVGERLNPATVRCRLFHDGIAIQLDPASLADVEGPSGAALKHAIAALLDERGQRAALRFEPYRMGSAFRHPARRAAHGE